MTSSPGRAGGQTVRHGACRQSSKTRVVRPWWWRKGKNVGAIHESPAARFGQTNSQNSRTSQKSPRHCEEPTGDVAIRNPCGATRRPAPGGPERCGLPRPDGPRNDVVIDGWCFCVGNAVIIPDRRGQCRPPYDKNSPVSGETGEFRNKMFFPIRRA